MGGVTLFCGLKQKFSPRFGTKRKELGGLAKGYEKILREGPELFN